MSVFTLEALQAEQEAFDQALPEMLAEHPDQYVVVHDRIPVGFFATYNDAYATALERFGLDETFLISQVVKRTPQPASVAWEAGVMFATQPTA